MLTRRTYTVSFSTALTLIFVGTLAWMTGLNLAIVMVSR